MEKDLFEGMRLVAIGGDRPKVSGLAMTVKKDRGQVYDAEDLKRALMELRDFIAFDLACELCENNSVNAQELSAKLMPLDYLVREVEFKEVEVFV